MDKFAFVEWSKYARSGSAQSEAMGKQFARLVMAHIDCDTIPFFWRYASRFTIFDNIFATDPQRSRDDRRAIGRDPMGQTPGSDGESGR
jgi:phospholipase C